MIDGVALPVEYHDEMLMMDMDHMVRRVLREPTPTFQLSDISEVFTIKKIEDPSLVLTPKVSAGVTTIEVVFEDVVSSKVVEFGTMDAPLYFDVLSGFVSHSDDVLTFSSMDLIFF